MKTIKKIILALILLLLTVWFVTTQPLFINPERVNTPAVNPEILESHVVMLSQTLPAREGTEKSLKPTLNWIEQQIKPFGNSYRQSYKVDNENFHNILLDFGPGPETEEIIIIGAHYDTAHGYPGADDNASGVAALIELARLLSENESALKNGIQLVFYTLEEPPYFRTNMMGSYIHASQLKERQQKVKLMIALDMIGYFSDEKNSQNFPFPFMDKVYSNRGDFIAVVANLGNMQAVRNVKNHFKSATDLPVHSINAPTFIQGIDFSDHLNYWHNNYPAVLITDTSFMRNTAYHTKNDTADRLDYKRMAEVVKALYQTAINY